MSTVTVAIDRASLSLSALTIANDGATYQIGMDGLSRPGRTWRITSAPDSADVHGSVPIAAALEQTSIPLEVIVKSTSSSALNTAVDALFAALSQFIYPVTVTVDGVAKVWSASPATVTPKAATGPAQVAQFFEVFTVTIPIYPVSA
jgi:hypothetical protein